MRLSGGRIREVRHAMLILLGFSVITSVVALLIIVFSGKSAPSPYAPVPVIGREFEDVNWPPIHP